MSAPRSPSGDAAAAPRRPSAALSGLILALLAARLALAAVTPLTEDEAYYRLWAQAPALGYYDHPPMIAWWIWAGVHLAGDNALGIRLGPALATAATSFLVFDIARLCGGSRADQARSALWYNAMPLVLAGGFLATPDAPAALFWTASLWAVLQGMVREEAAWWALAGLAAGLAALSKYSALFLGPGMLLWLAGEPRGRAALGRPGPWIALGLAAALFGLNVAWNAAHGWETFAKQFGRITPHRLAPAHLGEFLLTEAVLLNPLLAAFLLRLGRGRGEGGVARLWPLLATSAPFFAYLVLHSLHDRIEAHWPAPLFPALAACAALAAGEAGAGWSRVRRSVAPAGFGLVALAGLYASAPLLGVPLQLDPAAPLRDWPGFSARLERIRQDQGAAWIGTTSYGLAAQLMAQPRIQAPVVQIRERVRWRGLVSGSAAAAGRPGLVVDLARRIRPQDLQICFDGARDLGVIGRGPPGEPPTLYRVFRVGAPRIDLIGAGCGAGND